jgi:hypothetical protein
MSKSAKARDRRKAADAEQRWLRLRDFMHQALYDTVIGAGLACEVEGLAAFRTALGAQFT